MLAYWSLCTEQERPEEAAPAMLRLVEAEIRGGRTEVALAQLALRLGADVPFFLDPRSAWVGGIGEVIDPIPEFPSLVLLIATPSPPLSTAAVFRRFAELHPELTVAPPGLRIRPSPAEREERTAALLAALEGRDGARGLRDDPLRNDLEAAAVALRPEIGRLRETMMLAGARAAAMSGSGPSVFGVFADQASASSARDRAEWGPATQLHVSRTLH